MHTSLPPITSLDRYGFVKYEYAVQSPSGLFYTGRVLPGVMWTDHPQEIFHYTEAGANHKINTGGFAGCKVVHLI